RRGVCRRCPQSAVLVGLHLLRTPGSHLGLISPRSLAYSICWDRLLLSFTTSFFTLSQFHKRFNLFIIRSTASLIGTEGGDSCGNSMSLETPECEAHGGSSHARGKRPPAVEINSFSSYPKNTGFTYKYIFCARKASRIFH